MLTSSPSLVEPGIKYFLNQTLKNCNTLKDRYYNFIFNVAVSISFFVILGILLYSRYKGKPNPRELRRKEIEKQKYIMSMIRNYHASKETGQITGLPLLEPKGHDIIY